MAEETRTGPDGTPYRLITREGVSRARFEGAEILKIAPEALTLLAEAAMRDCSFLLRPGHLAQWAAILDDPESSANDRGVALTLLKNAEIAARGVLPLCQDTGTAIVYAEKGEDVRTGGGDVAAIEEGIRRVYAKENLRYSQVAAVSMFEERNTGSNLPAQIEIEAVDGGAYDFLFLAKGGGSANKFFLYQETKAVLSPDRLVPYLAEKMRTLGTAACPPYHVGIAIGGTSAETTLKTAKLATTGYLDRLPTAGDGTGRPFRDAGTEAALLVEAQKTGIGAQFGGKHFALDVRVVRLARHGASCPIALGVSCSAHRNVLARIDRDGVWLEALERDPGRFIPARYREVRDRSGVPIDLRRPMAEILAELRKHPVKTRLSLTGPMIVARDMAHAKIKERLDRGEPMPSWMKDHPIYYAGPAKTPAGMPSGSFGPTTAGRMDSYADRFMAAGGSLVSVAKGNRSKAFVEACRRHGGFYLGSIGGPAAIIAQEHIRKVEVVEYPELGMEAVYRVEVEDFPAFILVDDKGNDFFE